MNLMIRALLIISLISSIMSCRVYDKLLDKVGESLDKKEVSVEPSSNPEPDTDAVTDMQDSDIGTSEENSGRSGRSARSLNDDSEFEQREKIISRDLERSSNESEQVLVVDEATQNLYDQTKSINNKADTQLVDIGKITQDLNKIKLRLDSMRDIIDTCESDSKRFLQRLRTRSSSYDLAMKQLLPKLDKAIEKIKKSSHVAEKTDYSDSIGTLEHAKGKFYLAKRKATDAVGYSPYKKEAQEAISSAEELFKIAKKYQADLKSKMKQIEEDFDELKVVHEALKKNIGLVN